MLFCSIKGANRGYIQVLLATSRNRIYFRRRSNGYKFYPFGPSLYNPTSVLSFFATGQLTGFWQNTGDTSILMNQMQDNISRFSVKEIKDSFLQTENKLLATTKLEELDIIPLIDLLRK
ncbi:hypothetical protein [Cardinium endosymbiont of Tipula unca]|uniref:hypothetical protein n=1 Tax=Cardinium endosymbiont of Tipula unca TaxID=3066216 RepID=UPI0030CF4A59